MWCTIGIYLANKVITFKKSLYLARLLLYKLNQLISYIILAWRGCCVLLCHISTVCIWLFLYRHLSVKAQTTLALAQVFYQSVLPDEIKRVLAADMMIIYILSTIFLSITFLVLCLSQLIIHYILILCKKKILFFLFIYYYIYTQIYMLIFPFYN